MNKNLWLLILSQIFAFTAAPVTVFLSGIIGSQFSPVKSLATLPMALSIVGIAIFAIFAAKVMSIIGRRAGFMFASVVSSLSSVLAAYSIIIESFILFNFSCFLLGAGVAFSHQYRFAAVETVKKDMAPKAISIILLAGIGSAFIGPNVANITKGFIAEHLYAGSYIALAALTLTSTIFLLFYEDGHIWFPFNGLENDGQETVYDIEVENNHSYLANGIVSHNCMISHGTSNMFKERMLDVSDHFKTYTCNKCGNFANVNNKENIYECVYCNNKLDFSEIHIPYPCKLFFQELQSMAITPRIFTK